MLTLVLLLDIVQVHDCNPNKGFVYQRLTMWSASNTKMWGLPSKNSNHSSRVPTFLLLNKGKKKNLIIWGRKYNFIFWAHVFPIFQSMNLKFATYAFPMFRIQWQFCCMNLKFGTYANEWKEGLMGRLMLGGAHL